MTGPHDSLDDGLARWERAQRRQLAEMQARLRQAERRLVELVPVEHGRRSERRLAAGMPMRRRLSERPDGYTDLPVWTAPGWGRVRENALAERERGAADAGGLTQALESITRSMAAPLPVARALPSRRWGRPWTWWGVLFSGLVRLGNKTRFSFPRALRRVKPIHRSRGYRRETKRLQCEGRDSNPYGVSPH